MKRWYLRLFYLFCWCSIGLLISVIAIWLGFLLYQGYSSLNLTLLFGHVPIWDAITGNRPVWGGIWPALIGTFSLVSLTMLFAIIPGVGCGIFLVEYASTRQKNWGMGIIDVLASMPSIVMGLFGFLLILLLRHTFWPGANTNLLLAAGCLAVLVLPVIIVTTCEAFEAIPFDVRLTAISLGMNHEECIRHLLLPVASKGILGGVVLALGRAAEDMAVIMLTGVVANSGLPAGLMDKFEALPFHIYVTAAEYQSPEELAQGYGTSLVLLMLSTILLICAMIFERVYKRYWKGVIH